MATQGTVRNPIVPPTILPTVWANSAIAYDVRLYSDVEVQVVGLVTPYTFQRSLDNSTFFSWNVYDKNGNTSTAVTTDGIYTIDGSGWIKFTGGTGATITIRASS